jgi:hypothetical protein
LTKLAHAIRLAATSAPKPATVAAVNRYLNMDDLRAA